MLTWVSQAMQYENFSDTHGIVYFAGDLPESHVIVDCLLYYSDGGQLIGILNHYPVDIDPWEKKGNVNLWVHPQAQRMGVGTALITETEKRWGPINWEQQSYSEAGAAFIKWYIEESANG